MSYILKTRSEKRIINLNRQQNRRGAIGSELYTTAPTCKIINLPVALPPLKMIKQEALEDKRQNKHGKFLNFIAVREQYRITIVNGKVYYKGLPLTTKESGRFKFVQDQNKDLFGVESSDAPDGIKHSSLLGWEWPISAGVICATKGVIQIISGASGHFRPSVEHLNYTANYLRQNGVLVKQVCPFWMDVSKTHRVKGNVIAYRKKYIK